MADGNFARDLRVRAMPGFPLFLRQAFIKAMGYPTRAQRHMSASHTHKRSIIPVTATVPRSRGG